MLWFNTIFPVLCQTCKWLIPVAMYVHVKFEYVNLGVVKLWFRTFWSWWNKLLQNFITQDHEASLNMTTCTTGIMRGTYVF